MEFVPSREAKETPHFIRVIVLQHVETFYRGMPGVLILKFHTVVLLNMYKSGGLYIFRNTDDYSTKYIVQHEKILRDDELA